jgi:pimeloyl-ACP methyl ester carboxylesterase
MRAVEFPGLAHYVGLRLADAPKLSDGSVHGHLEAERGSITVQVLILDGAEDAFIKPDQPVRMVELIPGAKLVLMPGTGHFAMFARPGLLNLIVLDYLAGKAPSVPGTPPAGCA